MGLLHGSLPNSGHCIFVASGLLTELSPHTLNIFSLANDNPREVS